MEPTTGGRNDVGRIFARRAWILLKKGKTELMVHEIAVNCGNGAKSVGLGLPNLTVGKTTDSGLGKMGLYDDWSK